MGSMSIKGSTATTDNAGGTAGSNDKHTEITLTLSF